MKLSYLLIFATIIQYYGMEDIDKVLYILDKLLYIY